MWEIDAVAPPSGRKTCRRPGNIANRSRLAGGIRDSMGRRCIKATVHACQEILRHGEYYG